MPMGIVSDEDFAKEKGNLSPTPPLVKPTPIQPAEIVDVNRGRPPGSVEVPNSLRKIIGEASVTGGRQEALALANAFGISPSSASAYAVGATSTSSYNETPNKPVINEAKIKVQKKARQKMLLAMNKLTPDKLDATNAKDLSGIAKDMSAIIRNMEPESATKPGDNPSNGPTFIFYSPQQKKEEDFDVVFAKE